MVASQSKYDAVVVGAGPSGSRTARLLSEQGYSVALVERNSEIGTPVHCTGIVSADCMQRYQLPESLVLKSIKSFTLRSPSGSAINLTRNETQAYVLDRVELDRYLVSQAIEFGAHLFKSTEINDIKWTGKDVVLTGNRVNSVELNAKVAILASGYGSTLSRKLGFNSQKELLSGAQAIVSAPEVEQLEVFTGRDMGKGGFGWLLPWKPGLALIGVLTRKHTVWYMREHIQRLQREGIVGNIEQTFRCRPVPLQPVPNAVQDGILGVGDVVGQIKPTTGGGIYFGLLGADIAAGVLNAAIDRGLADAAALSPYDAQWRKVLETEIRQGFQLRRIGEQFPETVIEQLHRLMRVPVLRNLFISTKPHYDWHSTGLLQILDRFRRYA